METHERTATHRDWRRRARHHVMIAAAVVGVFVTDRADDRELVEALRQQRHRHLTYDAAAGGDCTGVRVDGGRSSREHSADHHQNPSRNATDRHIDEVGERTLGPCGVHVGVNCHTHRGWRRGRLVLPTFGLVRVGHLSHGLGPL